jgi:hypothetical protein
MVVECFFKKMMNVLMQIPSSASTLPIKTNLTSPKYHGLSILSIHRMNNIL